MSIPGDLRYTKEHEWIRIEGKIATVGITHHAQWSLGDIVFCELPKVGSSLSQMKTFGVVESVKAVSDLYAPLSAFTANAGKRHRTVQHRCAGVGDRVWRKSCIAHGICQ